MLNRTSLSSFVVKIVLVTLWVPISSCSSDGEEDGILDLINDQSKEELCEKTCDSGFRLNTENCKCEEDIVPVGIVPFTDPENTEGWVLNEQISDEFEGTVLDEEKWLIQGRDGVYRSRFKGRSPWQFSTENVRLENGMLKIQIKYEPDFDWVDVAASDRAEYKYTTAGINSKKSFKFGYIEIKSKLPVAKAVGSLWTTGDEVSSELDVYEAIGKGPRENKMWSSIHDWSIPNPNVSWTETNTLPFSFSDGFHIYGAEWEDDIVKIYADGQLIKSVTQAWVEENGLDSKKWPLDGGQFVWIDSEIFPWWGEPDVSDLPADYEIEYLRVWQKN